MYHSQISPYKGKLIYPQRLGEDICKLMVSGNKLHIDILLLNMISDEVMSDVNVLCFSVLNWVFGKADCACIITEDGSLWKFQAKIPQLIFQPQHLCKQLAAAIYSASMDDSDTQVCFLLAQDTRQPPRKAHWPLVLFLSVL